MKTKTTKALAVIALLFALNANAQDSIGWNGNNGNNGNGNGGWNGNNGGGGWNGDGGHNGGGAYLVERQVLCESIKHNSASCSTGLDQTQSIYMARQISKAPCIDGSTFRINRDRIDVNLGCRAYFVARGLTSYPLPSDNVLSGGGNNGGGGGGWNGGGGNNGGGNGGFPGQEVTYTVRCESFNNQTVSCRIPLRRITEAYLEHQLSQKSCVEGYSYRIRNRAIDVTNGCRATFVVTGLQ